MPGIGSIAFPVVALLAWLLAAAKAGHVRRDRANPSQRAMLAVFVFIALTVSVGSPPLWHTINGYSRYGDLATLYAQTFAVAGMASALCLLVLWTYPPEHAMAQIYLRLVVIALALAAMITLFVAVDPDHSRFANQLGRWYAASPGYIAYLLVYQSVVAATMIDIAQLCARYASRVKDRHVRNGLAATAAGALFVLAYSLVRLTDIVCAHLGFALPHFENVATLCGALGAVLIMTGLTFPSWAARSAALARRRRRRRAYRQMKPLWQELVRAAPDIVLESHSETGTPAASRDFEFKLRRRVIEIHDGELALRPFRSTQVVASARAQSLRRKLTGAAQAAFIEATCLHAALTAKAEGRTGDGSTPDYTYTGSDLDDELRWLALLSKTFTRLKPRHR
jgi:hypothetical protein